MPVLRTVIQDTHRQLEEAGIPDARIEADLIWMTALEVDRAELYARTNQEPTTEQAGRAEALMTRLRQAPV